MTMIATGDGLLSQSLPNTTSLLLSPSLCFEVVVDFTMFNKKEKVYIETGSCKTMGADLEARSNSPSSRHRVHACSRSASAQHARTIPALMSLKEFSSPLRENQHRRAGGSHRERLRIRS